MQRKYSDSQSSQYSENCQNSERKQKIEKLDEETFFVKIENGRKKKGYIKTMLVDCKSWGGSGVSFNELQLILRQNHDYIDKLKKLK